MTNSTHRRYNAKTLAGGLVATLGLVAAASLVDSPAAPAQAASAASVVSAGQNTTVQQHTDAPGELFRRTELYFGSQRPKGAPVTEGQFDRFVDKVVTPRFPDGLTQLTGEGQFNGSTGPIEEKSFVVILFYPVDDKQADREIEEIREAYKDRFQQESVLRADSRDLISF